MRKRRDCLSLWRIWRKASPAASSLSSSMSSSSTPSSRSEQVWEKSNQFITGWRQNQISKKSNQSPLGDVAHIQIPAPPSLRNWYRRRMRHEERLKVLNFSPQMWFCFISALNNSYLRVLSDHGQSSRCFPGWHHKHLPSSNAASRPRFPKPELQKVCKSLPQARTLPWCLSGGKFWTEKMLVGRQNSLSAWFLLTGTQCDQLQHCERKADETWRGKKQVFLSFNDSWLSVFSVFHKDLATTSSTK